MGDAGVFCRCHLDEASLLSLAADDMAIFVVLNVGDGDAIVIRLPEDHLGPSYAIVDAFDADKVIGLVDQLNRLEGRAAPNIRFVCATHPHRDHIKGLSAVLDRYGGEIEQFWDGGFPTGQSSLRGKSWLVSLPKPERPI